MSLQKDKITINYKLRVYLRCNQLNRNMRALAVVILAVTVASSYAEINSVEDLSVYNYHAKVGIPEAIRIKNLENEALKTGETGQRIVGGSLVDISQVPYQVRFVIF